MGLVSKNYEKTSTNTNSEDSVQQCFFHQNGEWFIQMKQEHIGPFADKMDAQMALMYYSIRALWPNDKELRRFARQGR